MNFDACSSCPRREQLYIGLASIAARLGVGERQAREWLAAGFIRAVQICPGGPWMTNETRLAEDVKNLPESIEKKVCQ